MRIKTVRIISWFGNDKIREKRKEIHHKQIQWFKQHKIDVVVFAQHYEDNEYIDSVRYIKNNDNLLLPGDARNILLKDFYESDEDHHMDGKSFFTDFNSIKEHELARVDFFLPMNPQQVGFNELYEKNSDVLQKNIWLSRTYKGKGSFFALKNLNKVYKTQLYFDQKSFTDQDGKIISGEDIAFVMNMIQHGYGTFENKNILLKEYSANVSTWTDNTEERKLTIEKCHDILKDMFGVEAKRGSLDYSGWLDSNFKMPKNIYISKGESWFD